MNDDAPLTLQEACDQIFRGNISPATLRAEARRGRLVIERIGRRDFVTPAAIREMRKLCEISQAVPPKEQGHWSERQRAEAAQAAAMKVAKDLRRKQ